MFNQKSTAAVLLVAAAGAIAGVAADAGAGQQAAIPTAQRQRAKPRTSSRSTRHLGKRNLMPMIKANGGTTPVLQKSGKLSTAKFDSTRPLSKANADYSASVNSAQPSILLTAPLFDLRQAMSQALLSNGGHSVLGIPRAAVGTGPGGEPLWNSVGEMPGRFDPSSLHPQFETSYWSMQTGLRDSADAPWRQGWAGKYGLGDMIYASGKRYSGDTDYSDIWPGWGASPYYTQPKASAAGAAI